ncbi:MAG: hypothetical protein ACOYJL_07595 [Tractidigestivibacter sp.]|jgi:hypothetical protein|uniref:hypothetical protein n=1 Tax=Tractidigestivibacter sp. TaxID=2847320 RepID=UPI003D9298B1
MCGASADSVKPVVWEFATYSQVASLFVWSYVECEAERFRCVGQFKMLSIMFHFSTCGFARALPLEVRGKDVNPHTTREAIGAPCKVPHDEIRGSKKPQAERLVEKRDPHDELHQFLSGPTQQQTAAPRPTPYFARERKCIEFSG